MNEKRIEEFISTVERGFSEHFSRSERLLVRAAFETAVHETREEMKERCAKIGERRAEDRFTRHGTYEPDTNASYYSGKEADELIAKDEEDQAYASEIRALEDE